MSADPTRRLYRPGDSAVHRLPPHCKLLALFGFVAAVVSTPRQAYWAFGAYAVLLVVVAAISAVPAGFVVRRMLVETPFVAFALLLPFVARGPTVRLWGLTVSHDGLLGAWNILAKGTLGVVAGVLLAATTESRTMLIGLHKLRMPAQLVQIMSFMLRYAGVITAEMGRMRIARESRGFLARDLRQAPAVARSAGALFIRSYERGERVHLAMLSRGYTGTMPTILDAPATRAHWAAAATLPLAAGVVWATALTL